MDTAAFQLPHAYLNTMASKAFFQEGFPTDIMGFSTPLVKKILHWLLLNLAARVNSLT